MMAAGPPATAGDRPPSQTALAWRLVDQVTDICAVSLLWLLASLPLLTIGAATAAANQVYLRPSRPGRQSVIRPFWTAFRGHWRSASLVWALLAGAGLLFAFNLGFYLSFPDRWSWAGLGAVAMGGLFAVTVVVAVYSLILISQADQALPPPSLLVRLRTSLKLIPASWPWALVVVVVSLGLPAGLAATRLWQFIPLLGGVMAYLNCRVLVRPLTRLGAFSPASAA